MKKRLIVSVVAAILLLSALVPAAFASEVSAAKSGTCGDGLTWELEDYTLTISGSGEMEDGCPWANWRTKVEHVVLKDGVTKIGKEAFTGFDRLETVDFGDALVEIGAKAFQDCDDLSIVHLPATFRTFGAQCFRDCTDLKYVYCDGPMPRFNDSCLWTGNYIAVFYPTNNPWPVEAVSVLTQSFGGQLGIMMGNYDPDAVAALEGEETEETEETEEQTEPEETEETVPETTEAVEAAAVAETTEATEAPTQAPTEPETEPTETTVPETEPTTVPTTAATTEAAITEISFAEEETTEETEPVVVSGGGSSWIGLVMIAGVLTFLIAGAMIFRSTKRGRY